MKGALLLVVALGCVPTSSPPRLRPRARPESHLVPVGGSSPLDDMLRNDLSQDHAFPWSTARRLTWDDFQGNPPTQGREGAKTAYSLYSAWRCRGTAFEFRVTAAFRPHQSWVKQAVLDDPEQRRTVLDHEQTHFDLGEVYARKMRDAFAHLVGACRRSDAQLGAVVERVAAEEKEEQRRYDAETNHGLLAAPQAAWILRTRRLLAASR